MLGYRGLKGIWCFLLNLVAHQSPTQDNNPKSYPVPGKSRDSQNRIAPVIFHFLWIALWFIPDLFVYCNNTATDMARIQQRSGNYRQGKASKESASFSTFVSLLMLTKSLFPPPVQKNPTFFFRFLLEVLLVCIAL